MCVLEIQKGHLSSENWVYIMILGIQRHLLTVHVCRKLGITNTIQNIHA